jgi:2-polyprenyl-3-methyl-5-hydroxy-6-metoxy-1,4-benzoquinol methylase
MNLKIKLRSNFNYLAMKSIKASCSAMLQGLNLHRDLAFSQRWKYRKYFLKGQWHTLDVGGGGGPFTGQALKNGNTVTLIDLDQSKIDKAMRRLNNLGFSDCEKIKGVACDIRKYETENKFDQIILFEVLEHIKNDQEVLNRLSSFLKPGGQLLFSSPRDDYHLFYGERVSATEDGGHVRKGYAPEGIREKMRLAGLKVIFMESYIGFFTQKSLALTRYISDNFISHIYMLAFLKLILFPLTYLDKLVPDYPDYCLFVIAKKE